tara:strand:- start:2153 stop:3844 length:1692 start_codon:yes stop_codon:yes gene_type:complete
LRATTLYKYHIKRLRLVFVFIAISIMVSALKTLYVQLFKYQELNIVKNIEVSGKRGGIYDRNGAKLAYDIAMYELFVEKNNGYDYKAVSSFMNKNFDLDYDVFDSLSNVSNNYFSLAKSVTADKINLINDEIKNIQGLRVSKKYIGRYYPKNNLSSQLIGKFSGKENKKGLWGVEFVMDDVLAAKKDSIAFKVSSRGSVYAPYSEYDYDKLSGNDVSLTIDVLYQRILESELYRQLNVIGAESANGLIINPYNGEILALASIPNINLNNDIPRNNDAYRDYSTFYDYEPGSTFKIFPVLTGIENKIISLDDKYFCENGAYKDPKSKRKITDHIGYDTLSVSEILSVSSNIGIAKIASDIGQSKVYNMMKVFGIGQKTGIEKYQESCGRLKEIDDWDNYSLASISMGQEILSNNLQIAMAYAALANGGYLLKPRLINPTNSDLEIIRKVSDASSINLVIEALKSVVSIGTASSLKKDYCMYGKTGTAEIYDIDVGDYSDSEYISTFAGVFPCKNPKLVCVVSFHKTSEDYRWAGVSAAPVVQNIFEDIFIEDRDFLIGMFNESE